MPYPPAQSSRYAEDRRLLKTQKNDVLDVIVKHSAFTPNDFDWEDVTGGAGHTVSMLSYRAEPQFRFVFDWNNYGWVSDHWPGTQTQRETASVSDLNGALYSQYGVVGWLRNLKREVNAPDRWAEFRDQASALSFADIDDSKGDTPFTSEEARLLHARVQHITINIQQNFNLPENRLRLIEGQLKKIDDAIKTSGRVSWGQFAVGVMFSIYSIIGGPSGQQVLDMAKILVAPLTHMLGP
jgi:hypothetical protein